MPRPGQGTGGSVGPGPHGACPRPARPSQRGSRCDDERSVVIFSFNLIYFTMLCHVPEEGKSWVSIEKKEKERRSGNSITALRLKGTLHTRVRARVYTHQP